MTLQDKTHVQIEICAYPHLHRDTANSNLQPHCKSTFATKLQIDICNQTANRHLQPDCKSPFATKLQIAICDQTANPNLQQNCKSPFATKLQIQICNMQNAANSLTNKIRNSTQPITTVPLASHCAAAALCFRRHLPFDFRPGTSLLKQHCKSRFAILLFQSSGIFPGTLKGKISTAYGGQCPAILPRLMLPQNCSLVFLAQ